VRGVFHCFTGTASEAKRILDAGYYLGFTGPVTFKKSDELRTVARFIPADRLLVETDSPYLSPEPVRGQKVNEPALVVHVAKQIAGERGIAVEELDEMTTANASRLFGWPNL
jgi:TatD DNase family protein